MGKSLNLFVSGKELSFQEAVSVANNPNASFEDKVCAYNVLRQTIDVFSDLAKSLEQNIKVVGIQELDSLGYDGIQSNYKDSCLTVSKKVKDEIVVDPAIKFSPTAKSFLKTSVTLQKGLAVKAYKNGTLHPGDAKYFSKMTSTVVNIKRTSVNVQNSGDDENNEE